MSDRRLALWMGSIASWGCYAVCAPAALAQEAAAPGPTQLETVTVTANKRAESVRDVPSSVSVLSGGNLEKLDAANFQDFASYVPGLSSASSGSGENQIVLRGVSTGASGSSSTVGVYVDETPIGSSSSFAQGSNALDFGVFDLRRVEVLSGPQGTLYGASTMGGLLKYVTTAPDLNSYDVLVQGELGHTQNGALDHSERGAFNLPLLKGRLGLRVDGIAENTTGYIDNPTLGQQGINASATRGGRISLLGQLSSDISLRLSLQQQDIHRQGASAVDKSGQTHQPLYGRYEHATRFDEPFAQHLLLYSAVLNWNLGWANATAVSGWQNLGLDYGQDFSPVYDALFDPALAPFGLVPAGTDVPWLVRAHGLTHKFTQEIRLASPSSGRFEWQVGGYYDLEHSVALVDLVDGLTADGQLAGGVPGYHIGLPTKFREAAAFADGTVHLGSRLDLTLGARYSGNVQTYTQQSQGILANPTNPNPYATDAVSAGSHETVATYLVNPRYRLGPDSIVYARFASGYRPGGPNFVAYNAQGQPQGSPTFKADTLWNYELGEKSAFLDRRLTLDADVYYIDWRDIQVESNVGGINQLENGGKAYIRGAEASGSYKLGHGLSLGGNLAYTDAKLGADAPALDAHEGQPLPLAPRFSAALTADYRQPLWDGISGNAGLSERFIGQRAAGFDGSANHPQYWMRSYSLLDLRFGLHASRWDLDLFVKNVFNQLGEVSADTSFLQYVPDAAVHVSIAQPRTVGLVATLEVGQ